MVLFFFNDTATTEIYTLSLHDALPIFVHRQRDRRAISHHPADWFGRHGCGLQGRAAGDESLRRDQDPAPEVDRKSTRLNSSHANISYAVFCLKKKQTSPSRTR